MLTEFSGWGQPFDPCTLPRPLTDEHIDRQVAYAGIRCVHGGKGVQENWTPVVRASGFGPQALGFGGMGWTSVQHDPWDSRFLSACGGSE